MSTASRCIDDKRIFARRRSRWTRRSEGVWRVAAKSDNPPKKREVYLLASAESGNTDQMAIRLPASSRAVAVLEAMRLRDVTRRSLRSADAAEELAERFADLIDVDQERIVTVR